MRLNDVHGFVFDVDGTLVHRAGAEVRPLPGASEVLDAIRESGRPFALFTNGSHMPPAAFARELREAGLPIADDQVLTPLCSMQTYLERHGDVSVLPFVTDSARDYLEEAKACGSWTDGEHEAHRRRLRRTSEGRRLRAARARRPRGASRAPGF